MVFIFVCLLKMKEEKFIASSWFIFGSQKIILKRTRKRNNLKFQRIKRAAIGNNGTSSVQLKEEEGPFCDPSLQNTHPGQYWCDIPLPITQHPPTHHPPPPHYNPHHPFLQSSCVNPGVALPLGCGLPGAEADAGICEQNSLWNPLHTRTHMHTRAHTHYSTLSLTLSTSLCSCLWSLSFHLYVTAQSLDCPQ